MFAAMTPEIDNKIHRLLQKQHTIIAALILFIFCICVRFILLRLGVCNEFLAAEYNIKNTYDSKGFICTKVGGMRVKKDTRKFYYTRIALPSNCNQLDFNGKFLKISAM